MTENEFSTAHETLSRMAQAIDKSTRGAPPAPKVHLDNCTVTHRHETALDGVSLRVEPGEFLGIIGPNGAGKTTLLTVVNGLTRLSGGTARVLGMDPQKGSGSRLRARVGYVAQVERIDPRLPMSVREAVMVGAYGRMRLFRRPGPFHWAAVEEALEKVGVAHLAERPLGHLSGGEYQRVAIARALVQEPDVFLFDEPTASIDPHAQREILDLIGAIHAEFETTTLYVTHDLATLPEACTRLVLMKDGAIWRQGLPEDMLDDSLLADLYASAPSAKAPDKSAVALVMEDLLGLAEAGDRDRP